jgi:hypothetical protein
VRRYAVSEWRLVLRFMVHEKRRRLFHFGIAI